MNGRVSAGAAWSRGAETLDEKSRLGRPCWSQPGRCPSKYLLICNILHGRLRLAPQVWVSKERWGDGTVTKSEERRRALFHILAPYFLDD